MLTFNSYLQEAKISSNRLEKILNIIKKYFEKKLQTKFYRFGGPKGFSEIKHGLGILYFYGNKKAIRFNYIKGTIASITLWDSFKLGKKGDRTIDLGGLNIIQALRQILDVIKTKKTGTIETYPLDEEHTFDSELLFEAKRISPADFLALVTKSLQPGEKLSEMEWNRIVDIALENDRQIPGAVRKTKVTVRRGKHIYDLTQLLDKANNPEKVAKNVEPTYYIKITAQDPESKKFLSVKGDKKASELLQKIDGAVKNPDIKKEIKDPNSKFGIMHNLVQLVARGSRNSLVIYGGPGTGKCAAPEEKIQIKETNSKNILSYKELFNLVTKDFDNPEYDTLYETDKEIEVQTPDGWVKILGVLKKKGKGIKITTNKNNTFHGEEHHSILTPDGWEYLKDAKEIITQDNEIEKVVSIETTNETEFYDISLPPPHTYYGPNGLIHHNTHTVLQSLKSEGLTKNRDFFVVKGKITTASLYQTLFLHRKGSILVFDDTDSVWKDQEAANILKAALDSYDERVISWLTNRTVNVSLMSDEDKEQFNDDLDAKIKSDPSTPHKLPSEFIYNGRIIFISNLSKDKFDSAVLTRSSKIDMTLTRDEMFYRMESILEHLGDKNVPLETKKEILEFLKNQSSVGALDSVSMRTFIAAEDLYKSGLDNWKELLDYV